MIAAAIAATIGTDPDAPRLADRPRLLAEARARLREAEIAKRGAFAAFGDPLEMFRSDSDPVIVLGVGGGR